MIDDNIVRLDGRIDRNEQNMQEQKRQTDSAIADLAEQVTILVTTLQQWPHYSQPCDTLKAHLKEHGDWRKTLVQWAGGIVAAVIIMYISFSASEYIRMKALIAAQDSNTKSSTTTTISSSSSGNAENKQ